MLNVKVNFLFQRKFLIPPPDNNIDNVIKASPFPYNIKINNNISNKTCKYLQIKFYGKMKRVIIFIFKFSLVLYIIHLNNNGEKNQKIK